jgi:hypothetical protein
VIRRKARRAAMRVGLGSQMVRDRHGRVDVYVSYLAAVECAALPEVVLRALARQARSTRAARAALN